MPRRSYDQFCAAARALDLIGERWTLLIVRELVRGQQRYTDLLEGLPGIGPNVLAARLKHLQEAGIVRRTKLPPPAASTVYELTELGRGLEPMMYELLRWGLNFLDEPRPDDAFRLDWMLGALRSMAIPEESAGLKERYEFRVSGHVFHMDVDDGTVEVRPGPASEPTAVFSTDFQTFAALGTRRLDSVEAAVTGAVTIDGDPSAAQRAAAILGVGRIES